MSMIEKIKALEILDSRGNPTLQVKVQTISGHTGQASVPSGASKGQYEAIEHRDQDLNRYRGKGVLQAIQFIHEIFSPALEGISVLDQKKIDECMIKLDGTSNKASYGSNALLGISLAAAKASASFQEISLYQSIGTPISYRLPLPLMNIINGGVHADSGLQFQEFMICPHGAPSFKEALRWGSEIFHALKILLKENHHSISVGDEGGFSPRLQSEQEALEWILKAIDKAGYRAGKEITLALDCAASEYYDCQNRSYLGLPTIQYIQYLEKLCLSYPISSLEDPLDQNDWEGWKQLKSLLPIQIIGDDLFVTHTHLLKKGIEMNVANGILIKPNQVGTLTETLQTIQTAKAAFYKTIMSHRSGETEDTSIADLAVGTQCDWIKAGSLSRSDRVAKYNRLLNIEAELGSKASFQHAF